jgi:hypothetical protein
MTASSGSFTPQVGDKNLGHSGGVAVLGDANGVLVTILPDTIYNGVTLFNHSNSDWVRFTVVYTPGATTPRLSDSDGIVPPRSTYSFNCNAESIVTIQVQVVDAGLSPLNGWMDSFGMTAIVPSAPVFVTVNMVNS